MALSRALAAGRRLFAHVRFALGAALVGAGAGLAVALLNLPPNESGFPASPALSRWTLALAPAVALGWWLGLLWGVALTLTGRHQSKPPVEGRPMVATLLAAALLVLSCAMGRLARIDSGASLAIGATAAVAVGGWWAHRRSRAAP